MLRSRVVICVLGAMRNPSYPIASFGLRCQSRLGFGTSYASCARYFLTACLIGPETVDRAIIGSERVVNSKTGVIQYQKNGKSIWETHPVEKERLIYQIGSSDPELALKAARTVEADV